MGCLRAPFHAGDPGVGANWNLCHNEPSEGPGTGDRVMDARFALTQEMPSR